MAADGSVIIETRVNDQNVEVTFKDIRKTYERINRISRGENQNCRTEAD